MIGAQLMEAYLGQKTPEEALAQAEADGNKVLTETRAKLGDVTASLSCDL
ncbi:MAG: hypothetical protein R2932_02590 [Caldilineaceae bacterium]